MESLVKLLQLTKGDASFAVMLTLGACGGSESTGLNSLSDITDIHPAENIVDESAVVGEVVANSGIRGEFE